MSNDPNNIDNSEIEEIIKRATKYAIKYKHKYVTIEHLTLALLSYKSFYNLVKSLDIDVDSLLIELKEYIMSVDELEVTGIENVQPRKTHGLERVF